MTVTEKNHSKKIVPKALCMAENSCWIGMDDGNR